jgi:tetratricopeptide (TPR) repeat protein
MIMRRQTIQRCSKGNSLFAGLFFAVCLTLSPCAESKSPENDLFGVLENDVAADMNYGEPNAVMDVNIQSSTGVVADDLQSADAASKDSWLIAKSPTTPLQRQLWEANVSASKESEMSRYKNELEQIIQQIRTIEIKAPAADPKFRAAAETVSEAEPNDMVTDPQPVQEPEANGGKQTTAGAVSEQTLQRFKDLAQNPDTLIDPLALAEVLFKSGCLQEAAVCYQAALNRKDSEEIDPFEDKAWIYLQLGNCLKDTDPQGALENYQAVIVEFPYSAWAPLAKVKSDLITWILENEPRLLINEPELDAEP